MSMASSKVYAEKRLKKLKAELEVRYPPTPNCNCSIKAVIKVVESWNKPSKGLLYYSCSGSKCGYFRWVYPLLAKWDIGGEDGGNVKAFDDFEDECEGASTSRVSEIGPPMIRMKGRQNLNFVVICMDFLVLLVVILMK